MALHRQWILWPNHPKHSQNHPWLVKANMKYHWSKEIWPPRSKLTQNRSFGLTRAMDFVAWPPKTQPKAPRTGWRPTWRTIGPRKSGLPVQKNVILQIISCGAKLRERSIDTLITPWPPSGPRSRRKWPTWTGRSSYAPARSSGLGSRLLWRPVGILLNKCVHNIHVNFFWSFH